MAMPPGVRKIAAIARRSDDEDHAHLVDEGGGSCDPRAGVERRVAGRILHRVTDFMGRDDDGGQRPAVEILRRQANRFRERMIMVTAFGLLDLDLRELHAVEQMAGEFGAGPRNFGTVGGVTAHHAHDPELRRHHQRQQEEGGRDCKNHESHGYVVDQPCFAEPCGNKKAQRAVADDFARRHVPDDAACGADAVAPNSGAPKGTSVLATSFMDSI
jgi:hypothetical protein